MLNETERYRDTTHGLRQQKQKKNILVRRNVSHVLIGLLPWQRTSGAKSPQ